ncbi:MAG: PAS domain S-box protein [Candidatus Acidiferrales bacterium]
MNLKRKFNYPRQPGITTTDMGTAGLTADRMHSVQFYTTEEFLVNELERFIGPALQQGSSAVIIATEAHRNTLHEKLRTYPIDISVMPQEGRYQCFDASEFLSRFMVDGEIDQFRFFDSVSEAIARASAASRDENHRVIAFGEMVALLWAEGKSNAAIQLERLWNALARTYCFSLHCAYPMQGFRSDKDAESFARICHEHSVVITEGSPVHAAAEDDRVPDAAGKQNQGHTLHSHVEWGHQEDRFRKFVEAVQDYAIFMLDANGRVTSWNNGAERIKSYRRSEILGSHFSRFYPSEDIRSGKPQKLLDLAEKMGRAEDEGWRIRKDGTRFWARVTITAIRNESGELVGFGRVTRDLTEQKRAELILHRQEERFQFFVHGVQDYAMFMLDPEGHVTTWNIGAERIKGYKASEIIGKHFSCFYPANVREEKPKWALEIAAREGRFEDQGWRLRKDGSKFWADVVITVIRDDDGQLIGFGKVTRDLTERMLAQQSLEVSQKKLRASEKALRELSLHLLRTQDEERRHIGREMHDSLGQYLSVLKIKLESMIVPAGVAAEIAECAKLLESCLREVRTVSYLLYPPMLEEMGLRSAVPWYLQGFSKRSGIKTTLQIPDDFGRLGRDVELVLFRVLQECLTNVQRHSESKAAEIRVCRSPSEVVMEVQDFGKGLPPSMFEHGSQDWMGSVGVGLRGMSERLQQLDGSLEIASDSKGTLMRATVPLQ